MLDRAGDSYRDVEIGCHDLARLSHLVVVGNIARVDGCARRADGRVELVRERFEELEVLAAAKATPARHDDPRVPELRSRRLRELLADDLANAVAGSDLDHFDWRRRRALRRLVEGRRADGEYLDGVG